MGSVKGWGGKFLLIPILKLRLQISERREISKKKKDVPKVAENEQVH